VSPAEARRQAARILRDAAKSMRRDVHEAERLLRLADGADDDTVNVRRAVEQDRALNPEFFVSLGGE
jgi:hypothetical protein